MEDYKVIEHVIERLIKDGKKQFVIYPFGEYGRKTKEILNQKYGIQEVFIVDNHKFKSNENILSVEEVENADTYVWLLTNKNRRISKEIHQAIEDLVLEAQIVDIFQLHRTYGEGFKLLSRIGNIEDTREPCNEFIELVKKKKLEKKKIAIAEIGVGYGTTSVEVCKYLDNKDTYECFDFEEIVTDLVDDLGKVSEISCKLAARGNSHKTYDSYSWELSNVLFEMRKQNLDGIYDVVYLDGFHSFFHDGTACCLIKELLKPEGYFIFDDMKWTLAKSRTMNPDIFPQTAQWFTKEQISDCQIQRVVDAFIANDVRFAPVYLGKDMNPGRAVFRKVPK